MPKHYAIELKVKNNYLLAKMTAAGIESGNALARAANVSYGAVCALLNLEVSGRNAWGQWRQPVGKIAEALKCLPEDLFPPQHVDSPLKRNKAVVLADASDVELLTHSLRSDPLALLEKQDEANALNDLLGALTPRERNVIENRFGLIDGEAKSLDDTAIEDARFTGASKPCQRERMRQIEGRALRTLRSEARKYRGLISPFDDYWHGNRFTSSAARHATAVPYAEPVARVPAAEIDLDARWLRLTGRDERWYILRKSDGVKSHARYASADEAAEYLSKWCKMCGYNTEDYRVCEPSS